MSKVTINIQESGAPTRNQLKIGDVFVYASPPASKQLMQVPDPAFSRHDVTDKDIEISGSRPGSLTDKHDHQCVVVVDLTATRSDTQPGGTARAPDALVLKHSHAEDPAPADVIRLCIKSMHVSENLKLAAHVLWIPDDPSIPVTVVDSHWGEETSDVIVAQACESLVHRVCGVLGDTEWAFVGIQRELDSNCNLEVFTVKLLDKRFNLTHRYQLNLVELV